MVLKYGFANNVNVWFCFAPFTKSFIETIKVFYSIFIPFVSDLPHVFQRHIASCVFFLPWFIILQEKNLTDAIYFIIIHR